MEKMHVISMEKFLNMLLFDIKKSNDVIQSPLNEIKLPSKMLNAEFWTEFVEMLMEYDLNTSIEVLKKYNNSQYFIKLRALIN